MAQEYVGINLHRRRSVIHRMDQTGDKIDSVRVDNGPIAVRQGGQRRSGGQPRDPRGDLWLVPGRRPPQRNGYQVHLANPHGKDWEHRRVKNDERDARDLADLLRLGRLAEAWIAPPKTRDLRVMIRFRMKPCNLVHRTQGPGPRGHGQERDPSVPRRHVGTGPGTPSSTRSSSRRRPANAAGHALRPGPRPP